VASLASRHRSDRGAETAGRVAVASDRVVLTVAQLSDPGDAVELLLALPAVFPFLLRGLAPRLPSELFAALVIVPRRC
jgi:hypothetical protein